MNLQFDDRDFRRALELVSRESRRADSEIVTFNGRTYLAAIVRNNPRRTGASRAGWTDAWNGLGMAGTPRTRHAPGVLPVGRRKYYIEGSFIDHRDKTGEASVEFVNRTHVVQQTKGKRAAGAKVFYIWAHNNRKAWMEKARSETTFKFLQTYDKLLAKHSR